MCYHVIGLHNQIIEVAVANNNNGGFKHLHLASQAEVCQKDFPTLCMEKSSSGKFSPIVIICSFKM